MKVKLRDRSGVRDYKHLWQDVDRHGNVRIYFARKGHPKVRLREQPGTEEFNEEYRRAFTGKLRPSVPASGKLPTVGGSLGWLCQRYFRSAAFISLGESTRKARRGILDAICQGRVGGRLVGTLPFAAMEPHHVAQIRDVKATLPEAANGRVKALRQLFKWAMSPEYSYAKRNPAAEVSYLSSNNPNGFKAWTKADVAKYEACHPIGTKARLALDLYLYLGVRRSDVVTLGPPMEQ